MSLVGVSIDGDGRTTQPSTNSFTVPTVANNDVGFIFVVQTTGINTVDTPPTGWTKHPDSPTTINSNVRAYCFYRTLTAAESGTTVNVEWTSGARTAGVMVVHRGVLLSGMVSNISPDTSSGSVIESADVVTGGTNWEVISFVAARSAITTGFSVTPPAGFTEDAEANTALTTSPNLVVSGNHLTTPGPATAYGGGNYTSTDSVTGVSYTFGLPPSTSNVAPTADAGPDQLNLEPWSEVTLVGSSSDGDGTIVLEQWEQITGPEVSLQNADTGTATFELPGTIDSQDYLFQFTVTDNNGGTDSDTMLVTALPVTERAAIGGVMVPLRIKAKVALTFNFLATETNDTITLENGDFLVLG